MTLRTLTTGFYWFLGLAGLANGLWMLLDPASWYVQIPAAVPDTGPLNQHFVHDVGVVYCLAGLGAIWCARDPIAAYAAHLGVMLFYVGHALVHVAEILVGMLPHTHWWIDLPLVFLPALVLAVLTVPAVRRRAYGQNLARQ
jgi:hypothetical protein